VADALRATGFGVAFFVLGASLGFAADFFAAVTFAGLRATGFAAPTRLAFGLDAAAGAALTPRFAVFAAGRFAFERVGDRRKPFVRLLLMGGISKTLLTMREQPPESPRSLPQLGPLINERKYLRVL